MEPLRVGGLPLWCLGPKADSGSMARPLSLCLSHQPALSPLLPLGCTPVTPSLPSPCLGHVPVLTSLGLCPPVSRSPGLTHVAGAQSPDLRRATPTLSRRPLCGSLPNSSTQGSQVTPLQVRALPGLVALSWSVLWGGALWLAPISTPSWQPVLGDKPRYSCSWVEITFFWPVWLPCQSSRHSSGRPLTARQNPLWN